MVYTEKLVLYVPCYAWDGEKLIGIDYRSFKADLYMAFEQIGLVSWSCQTSKGVFKGREYDQETLTIFSEEVLKSNIIAEFKRLLKIYHGELRQEAYAYEDNDSLVIIEGGAL